MGPNLVSWYCRSSSWSCSIKKGVLKCFANFTEKQLCWSLFFMKFNFEEHLRTTAFDVESWKEWTVPCERKSESVFRYCVRTFERCYVNLFERILRVNPSRVSDLQIRSDILKTLYGRNRITSELPPGILLINWLENPVSLLIKE